MTQQVLHTYWTDCSDVDTYKVDDSCKTSMFCIVYQDIYYVYFLCSFINIKDAIFSCTEKRNNFFVEASGLGCKVVE